MTALMLSTFLLVLGTGFLYFVQRDSWQSLQQERAVRADYAARAGVDFFYYMERKHLGTLVVDTPVEHELEDDVFFEVTKLSDNGCRSRGFLRDSEGTIRAERVLVRPGRYTFIGGDKNWTYDEKL